MPHIIVSYAKPILNQTTSGQLLKHLHKIASDFDTVSPEALKLRGCEFDQSWSGTRFTDHLHIRFELLSGRPKDLKESMAKALKAGAETFFQNLQIENLSISVEVKEFEVYLK